MGARLEKMEEYTSHISTGRYKVTWLIAESLIGQFLSRLYEQAQFPSR